MSRSDELLRYALNYIRYPVNKEIKAYLNRKNMFVAGTELVCEKLCLVREVGKGQAILTTKDSVVTLLDSTETFSTIEPIGADKSYIIPTDSLFACFYPKEKENVKYL